MRAVKRVATALAILLLGHAAVSLVLPALAASAAYGHAEAARARPAPEHPGESWKDAFFCGLAALAGLGLVACEGFAALEVLRLSAAAGRDARILLGAYSAYAVTAGLVVSFPLLGAAIALLLPLAALCWLAELHSEHVERKQHAS
jgi:hypothetical protein